jgi:hypothetical protein
MFIDDLSLQGLTAVRHDGKAKDQYFGTDAAATDTKPRTGMESTTTTDISDSRKTNGNEGQDVAALVAGRCLHGAKNNRIPANAQIGAFATVSA